MNTRGKILWILPKWPLPVRDGSRYATVSLIQSLTAKGIEIDICALCGHDEIVDESKAQEILGVRKIHVIRRAPQAFSHLKRVMLFSKALLNSPKTPVTLYSYTSPTIRSGIAQLIKSQEYGTLVYEGLHASAHSMVEGLYLRTSLPIKIIYRAQNCESELWRQRAHGAKSTLVRRFLFSQAKRVAAFENRLVSQIDGVAAVSLRDLELLGSYPQLAQKVVPISYKFDAPLPFPRGSSLKLLFVGRLDWLPNREGLKWFLERVWPQVYVKNPDLKLIIAGSGRLGSLGRLCSQPGITFLGEVDDLKPLYQEASLCLAPIFFGSGTRVKLIEASRFGRATLSTAQGVEGLALEPQESYFQAETQEQWVQALLSIDPIYAKVVGEAAFQKLKAGWSSSAESMEELLVRIHGESQNRRAA